MTHIFKKAQVKYTPKQMFDLVNDINRYHEFVDYCSNSGVIAESDESVEGFLEFSLGVVSQRIVTLNRIQSPDSVVMNLKKGPFKKLSGRWEFEALSQGTLVSLEMDFEMEIGITATLLKPLFQITAERLVTTFAKRADFIYGK